jgi:hypothetical protein
MIKKLIVITLLGIMSSGCIMIPMALVGPAVSGYSTASLIQSGASAGANFVVKRSTGKSIAEHAIASLTKDVLQQTYFPVSKSSTVKLKPNTICKKFDLYCVKN